MAQTYSEILIGNARLSKDLAHVYPSIPVKFTTCCLLRCPFARSDHEDRHEISILHPPTGGTGRYNCAMRAAARSAPWLFGPVASVLGVADGVWVSMQQSLGLNSVRIDTLAWLDLPRLAPFQVIDHHGRVRHLGSATRAMVARFKSISASIDEHS
jgi:hypothetical protein